MTIQPQSPLAKSIEEFLAHKRALGKQLQKAGEMLHLLDSYLLKQGVTVLGQLTPAHLEAFLKSRPRHSARSYNVLLGTLRGFFNWLVDQEVIPMTPLRTLPKRITQGRKPFLFSADQARQLLEITRRLPINPRVQDRGEIYRMIFTLLYVLGLRVGEVSRLCRKDLDLDNQVLVVRKTKFGKDRLIPFGPKIARDIREFLRCRERRLGTIPPDSPLFSFDKYYQSPIRPKTISQTFHNLIPTLGLTVPAGVASPHVHCLRHSFAVATLLRWYRNGLNPMDRLLDLSTFLGHVSPSSTAVYLTITPELLEQASQRFAHFAAPILEGGVR